MYTRLSERIVMLRDRHGLSQAGLARKTKISVSSLNAIERGLAANLTLRTLEKLWIFFQVSPDYLLGFVRDEEQMCRFVSGVNGGYFAPSKTYQGHPPPKCENCDALLLQGVRHTVPRCVIAMHDAGRSTAYIMARFEFTRVSVDAIIREENEARRRRGNHGPALSTRV
jgi:transcriptional regulator with XRE-family HTH domain